MKVYPFWLQFVDGPPTTQRYLTVQRKHYFLFKKLGHFLELKDLALCNRYCIKCDLAGGIWEMIYPTRFAYIYF
jgi:hypothetical protein